MDSAAAQIKIDAMRKQSFDRWMTDPLVRMTMSVIPAGEQKDALAMLVKAAYEAGFAHGQGALSVTIIEQMMVQDRRI